jgi:transposase-like protein/transposase Tn5 family protein
MCLLLLTLTAMTMPARRGRQPPAALPSFDWATQQFADARLGDSRRADRLITLAAQIAENPTGSIPQQTGTWADAKAAYDFLDNPHVSFTAIASPHWLQTRQCQPGRYLILGDTTEIAWRLGRQIDGAGPLGNGSGQGFLLHSGLMVGACTEEVHGLAAQTIRYRQPAPADETDCQRVKRQRESEVWLRVIQDVGVPPPGVEWVHVLDRGGDNFEVFAKVRECRTECVVRASVLHRKVEAVTQAGVGPGAAGGVEPAELKEFLQGLPLAGGYTLELRARPKEPARKAKVEVRFGAVRMPPPRICSAAAKREGPVELSVVWVKEVDSKAKKPVEWVLYSSLAVRTFAEAQQVIGYYEKRWIIEEWHKALKSGCALEARQLKEASRIERLVGILGVVAVRLLQLRGLARSEPLRAAGEVVPALYLRVLQGAKGLLGQDWTVRRFFHEVAKLGGWLGRKGDGEPGWITIWRGWAQLALLVRGYELGRTTTLQ